MKLTYWIAECKNDSPAYNVRAKTRKAVRATLADGTLDPADYGDPFKVVIEYHDAFDLAEQLLSEGGSLIEMQG